MIFRKQMFDQVYNHRVNASCDIMLIKIFEELIAQGKLKSPTSYSDFVRTDDNHVDSLISDIVVDRNIDQTATIDLSAKLFLTRTLLKKLYEKTVSLDKLDEALAEMRCLKFNGYSGAHNVSDIKLKELTRLGRTDGSGNDSIIRVFKDLTDGTRASSAVNRISNILRSNAWIDKQVKIVAFKSLYDSAIERDLKKRLELFPVFSATIPFDEDSSQEQSSQQQTSQSRANGK